MVDRTRSPVSVCERCPFDAHLCLSDYWQGWRSQDGTIGLRFTCPFIELSFEPQPVDKDPWRLTDLGTGACGGRGTVAVAERRKAVPMDAILAAADGFLRRGCFYPLPRDLVVDAMVQAYRAQLPRDPVLPTLRRALAEA